MNDPVLMSRLEALWQNLDVVSKKLTKEGWTGLQAAPGSRTDLLEKSLWEGLNRDLVQQLNSWKNQLKQVENNLAGAPDTDQAALKAAWSTYQTLWTESQGRLREALEIIGTMAIRYSGLDNRILHVADELITDCFKSSTLEPYQYLLVHSAADNTFSKTSSRIIRQRYPEWTIWDLPLAAHQLGHVLIDVVQEHHQKTISNPELRPLSSFLAKQQGALLQQDQYLNEKHLKEIAARGGQPVVDQSPTEAERWAESRVRVLAADMFATCIMGPAYACSTIILRLNPGMSAREDRPSDAARAQVILSVLRWVNRQASKSNKPYDYIINCLTEYWTNALDQVASNLKLSMAEERDLQKMADDFCGGGILYESAMYPYMSTEKYGWWYARIWSETWLKDWTDNNGVLSLPPFGTEEKLRDVLNATWLTRMQIEGPLQDQIKATATLAKVGQDLCNAMIEQKTGAPASGGSSAPGLGGNK